MSHHEGVSCDSCNKSNFCGKRYKCLVCFDYDLCSGCYNSGVTTTRHQVTHPMQCIITRSDFELFYGGESLQYDNVASYSYVCPHCGNCGLTHTQLFDHVMSEHLNQATEVICPVCAVLPGGHPNHMTDDLSGHLSMEHKPSSSQDLDEPLSRNIRRMFHPVRNIPPPRSRRSAAQQASAVTAASSANGQTGIATFTSRENFDPIAELLTQLSGVRRAAQQQSAATTASQLQILQQQLQFERMQVQQARERLERLPRKQPVSTTITATSNVKKFEPTNTDPSKYLLNQYYEKSSNKEENKEIMQLRKQQEQFSKEMLYTLLATETLVLTSDDTQNVSTQRLDKNKNDEEATNATVPTFHSTNYDCDDICDADFCDDKSSWSTEDSSVKTGLYSPSSNNSEQSIRKPIIPELSDNVDVINKTQDTL